MADQHTSKAFPYGVNMQMPVEIAFRHCEPSEEEIRSEIAAQVQRLEKFSPRITSCHVVVAGPQTGHRRGGLSRSSFASRCPSTTRSSSTSRHGDAPEREHALVAIREAFDAAVRQIEDVVRDMRGQVKEHAEESHGCVKKFLAGEIAASSKRRTGGKSIFTATPCSMGPSTD